ncbi:unnamed protein product [Cuscuta campestris]|uniref:Retrovirus-related Pol polyprotein from transposon TNT 1-94-like beta-barrel domain-containing protein n=1 Tax=Cuscuta campestris TaxID=132261 RepID=A0A484LZQ4_9ASTE|nr:unnamed protein product [Cuscuta campestris]
MTCGNSVRDLSSKFSKLEKFEGQDFCRWQKKMHFLLTTLKVVYVLSTPMPQIMDDDTLEQTRKRCKWENDDYICRGHFLNGMSDSLFDVYQNVESAKLLWDGLEEKYMAEDASSKKFLVSNFNNYKIVDSRPVMEQYNELLRILGQFAQHNMAMDESISVSSIIDKLPPLWKECKRELKHNKEKMNLVQLGTHLRIEESIRDQEGKKVKDIVGPSSINMTPKLYEGARPGYVKATSSRIVGLASGTRIQVRMVPVKEPRTKTNQKNDDISWWVDSGATCHVCKDKRWFSSLESMDYGSVLRMGNIATEPVKGIGIVKLVFISGKNTLVTKILRIFLKKIDPGQGLCPLDPARGCRPLDPARGCRPLDPARGCRPLDPATRGLPPPNPRYPGGSSPGLPL